MTNELKYQTGEPIQCGDSVRINNCEAVVESIITKDSAGWADYWQKTTGEGVMLVGKTFGRMFVKINDDEMIFLQRKQR